MAAEADGRVVDRDALCSVAAAGAAGVAEFVTGFGVVAFFVDKDVGTV